MGEEITNDIYTVIEEAAYAQESISDKYTGIVHVSSSGTTAVPDIDFSKYATSASIIWDASSMYIVNGEPAEQEDEDPIDRLRTAAGRLEQAMARIEGQIRNLREAIDNLGN